MKHFCSFKLIGLSVCHVDRGLGECVLLIVAECRSRSNFVEREKPAAQACTVTQPFLAVWPRINFNKVADIFRAVLRLKYAIFRA